MSGQQEAAIDSKARENRLRRMAERQGLALRKSKRRDPYAPDFGGWWIVEPNMAVLVAGGSHGLDLDAVEEWLKTPPSER